MFRTNWFLRTGAAIVGFIAIALILTATAMAATKVRIGLAIEPYGPYAPVRYAEKMGYYQKYGVDPEISAFRGGAAAQQAMAAGAVDIISFVPPGAALGVKKGMKIKVIAAQQVRPHGWHFMVKKDSPYKSLKDLDGKRIAVSVKGTYNDMLALWAAEKAGIKIQTVPVGGRGLVAMLKSGQVDGSVIFAPFTYGLLISGEGRSLLDYEKEMPPNVGSLAAVWIATDAFIEAHPQAIHGALKGISKAAIEMINNPAMGKKFLKTYIRAKDDRVVDMDYRYSILTMSVDGMIKPEWIKASMGLARFVGVTEMPAIREVFTDKFIPIKVD